MLTTYVYHHVLTTFLTFATTSRVFVENFFSTKPFNSVIILGLYTSASKILFEKMQKNCKKNAKFLIEILKWLTKIMLRLVKKEALENWFSRFYVIFDKEDKNSIFRGSISFRCAKNQISKRNFQENDVNDLTLTLSGIVGMISISRN